MKKFKALASILRLSASAVSRSCSTLLLITCVAVLSFTPAKVLGQVHPRFELNTPAGGPFPSDLFTVADRTQNTRRRVNLPKPDCALLPSDCEDLDGINSLDGFKLLPRLSIPFDAPIDLATVNESVFLIRLGDTLSREDHGDRDDRRGANEDRGERDKDRGRRTVGINRVVWDPLSNSLHVEADAQGRPVERSEAFSRFRHELRGDYKQALLEAIQAARRVGIRGHDIASASVFKTLSATANLEKIRNQIKRATPGPADFNLNASGARTVFPWMR